MILSQQSQKSLEEAAAIARAATAVAHLANNPEEVFVPLERCFMDTAALDRCSFEELYRSVVVSAGLRLERSVRRTRLGYEHRLAVVRESDEPETAGLRRAEGRASLR